ncbi:TPA: class B sortase, LPKTxAVK-specific [Streptococcus suis]
MNRSEKHKRKNPRLLQILLGILVIVAMGILGRTVSHFLWDRGTEQVTVQTTSQSTSSSSQEVVVPSYQVSPEEKAAMQARFTELKGINPDTVAYIYAPGTPLDEPVVQTTDNETYLDKTFEGGHQPYFGTVFMDTESKNDFSDPLTWMFGHVRGPLVDDERIFQTVTYYENQAYFDQHPFFVVQTPERILYYQAAFTIVIPETTHYYKHEFADGKEFVNLLALASQEAVAKNPNLPILSTDHYLVLATCRAEDLTTRAVLFLRQIPDSELEGFLEQHGSSLTYVPTR